MKNIRVAIDGPSGAGKSTISKIAAHELGFIYIDTGAMYRAVGLKAIRNGLDTKNDIPQIIDLVENISIEIKHGADRQLVFLDGKDVTDKIRTPEVSSAASNVSAVPRVRKRLVELQRLLAQTENVIMDGRDIGTHVIPNAEVKIFLTASLDDRAKRRYDELVEKGISCEYEDVRRDMRSRDENDSTRECSPLEAAADAIMTDTSGNSLEQSVSLIINTIKERLK